MIAFRCPNGWEMGKIQKKKWKSKIWLNADINGSAFIIRGFRLRAKCKAHVMKHILGLQYDDSFWDKQRWNQLFYRLNFDRNQVLEQMSAVGSPVVKQRDEIRKLNSMFMCENTCRECEKVDPMRCNRVLMPLIYSYEEVIKRALYYSQTLPRFTLQIEMGEEKKGLNSMYHLDSMGVFVVSLSESVHQTNKLHVVTCYRPVPPLKKKWGEEDLHYAKESCFRKCSAGDISILALYNEETWGFTIADEGERGKIIQGQGRPTVRPRREQYRYTTKLYDRLDEESRRLLDSLKTSLSEGKKKREN